MALTVSFNLFKTAKGYDMTFSAEENGKIIHEENLEGIVALSKKALVVRKKTVALNKKAITFGINIIGKDKVKTAKVVKAVKVSKLAVKRVAVKAKKKV